MTPTGSATAGLADGTEDTAYVVSETDLLQGFSVLTGIRCRYLIWCRRQEAYVTRTTGTAPPRLLRYLTTRGRQPGYSVIEPSGGSVLATELHLMPTNDAPVAVTDHLTIARTRVKCGLVLSNDYDVDGDELRLQGSITNFFGHVDGVDVDGEAVIGDDRRRCSPRQTPTALQCFDIRSVTAMNTPEADGRCISLLSRSTIQSSHVTTASLLVQSSARGMSSPLPRPSMSSATNGTLTAVVYQSLGPPLIREALCWWSRIASIRIPRARSTSSLTNRRRDLLAPRP